MYFGGCLFRNRGLDTFVLRAVLLHSLVRRPQSEDEHGASGASGARTRAGRITQAVRVHAARPAIADALPIT